MYCQMIKVLATFFFWFGKRYRRDEFCLFFLFLLVDLCDGLDFICACK